MCVCEGQSKCVREALLCALRQACLCEGQLYVCERGSCECVGGSCMCVCVE